MTNSHLEDYCNRLDRLHIAYTTINHPHLRQAGDILQLLGLGKEQSIPTLIMKADDSFIAVVLRGDTRADFRKIKRHLAVRNLRLATAAEFKALTGLPPGAAQVYNPGLTTLVDERVFEQDQVMGGSGVFDCSIRYRSADLKKIPGVQVIDLAGTD